MIIVKSSVQYDACKNNISANVINEGYKCRFSMYKKKEGILRRILPIPGNIASVGRVPYLKLITTTNIHTQHKDSLLITFSPISIKYFPLASQSINTSQESSHHTMVIQP